MSAPPKTAAWTGLQWTRRSLQGFDEPREHRLSLPHCGCVKGCSGISTPCCAWLSRQKARRGRGHNHSAAEGRCMALVTLEKPDGGDTLLLRTNFYRPRSSRPPFTSPWWIKGSVDLLWGIPTSQQRVVWKNVCLLTVFKVDIGPHKENIKSHKQYHYTLNIIQS